MRRRSDLVTACPVRVSPSSVRRWASSCSPARTVTPRCVARSPNRTSTVTAAHRRVSASIAAPGSGRWRLFLRPTGRAADDQARFSLPIIGEARRVVRSAVHVVGGGSAEPRPSAVVMFSLPIAMVMPEDGRALLHFIDSGFGHNAEHLSSDGPSTQGERAVGHRSLAVG